MTEFTQANLFEIRQRVLDSGPDAVSIEEMSQVITFLRAERTIPAKTKSKVLTETEVKAILPDLFGD